MCYDLPVVPQARLHNCSLGFRLQPYDDFHRFGPNVVYELHDRSPFSEHELHDRSLIFGLGLHNRSLNFGLGLHDRFLALEHESYYALPVAPQVRLHSCFVVFRLQPDNGLHRFVPNVAHELRDWPLIFGNVLQNPH